MWLKYKNEGASIINLEKLRCRIISEKVLVETFGTETQKQSYDKYGRFICGKSKLNVLNVVKRYCSFTDLGNKEYSIDKVYQQPIPKEIFRAKNNSKGFAISLFLYWLLNKKQPKYELSMIPIKWAYIIGMTNLNYYTVRNYSKKIAYDLGIDQKDINDYCEHANDMIRYNILGALEILKDCGAVSFSKVKMICECTPQLQYGFTQNRIKCYVKICREIRQATDNETQFIEQCKGAAKQKLNIDSDKDCYWGAKAPLFRQTFTDAIMSKNILFYYDAYKVDLKNKRIAKDILETYVIENFDQYLLNGNEIIKNKFIDNIKKRLEMSDKLQSEKEKLLNAYLTLVEESVLKPYLLSSSKESEFNEMDWVPIDVVVQGIEYIERSENYFS